MNFVNGMYSVNIFCELPMGEGGVKTSQTLQFMRPEALISRVAWKYRSVLASLKMSTDFKLQLQKLQVEI